MIRDLTWKCLLVLLSLVGTTRVQASTNEDRARLLVKQGKAALNRRDFHSAARCFEEAFRHWPRREIRFNLALTYDLLGDKIKAATHLVHFLERASAKEREKLLPRFRRLMKEVGVVRVQSSDAGASVWVDGNRVGQGSSWLVVFPGVRAVEIRKKSLVMQRRVFTLQGGQQVLWIVGSIPAPRARPHPKPPLHLVGIHHPVGIYRPSGLHWGYFTGAAAVTLALAASLLATGIRTEQLADDYSRSRTDAIKKEFERTKLATNILIGLTCAGAVGTVTLALFTRWTRSSKTVSVVPAVSPKRAALQLRLRF